MNFICFVRNRLFHRVSRGISRYIGDGFSGIRHVLRLGNWCRGLEYGSLVWIVVMFVWNSEDGAGF